MDRRNSARFILELKHFFHPSSVSLPVIRNDLSTVWPQPNRNHEAYPPSSRCCYASALSYPAM